MKFIRPLIVALALASGGGALAGEAGDAVFAERGPWALGERVLDWQVTVEGPPAEGFQPVQDGALRLAEVTDPSDGQPVLQLTVSSDGHDRRMGPFPVSGGDPVLTYFLEQTARDMVRQTGGSPFYIRNRIKDALFRGGEITRDGDDATAVFRPFADDPNAERMQGFQTLTLTFDLTGGKDPIRRLSARTEGTAGRPAYASEMVLQ